MLYITKQKIHQKLLKKFYKIIKIILLRSVVCKVS